MHNMKSSKRVVLLAVLGVVLLFPTSDAAFGTRSSLQRTFQARPTSSRTFLQAASSSSSSSSRRQAHQHKDIVIVGGGLAGLSTAFYLCQLDPTRHVTILERDDASKKDEGGTTVASFAAAGMLAPQSERLPPGPLLDLCIAARNMYPDFVELVESLATESGSEGSKYLLYGQNGDKKDGDDDRYSVGYVANGGFLAPALAGDSVATWAPPEGSGTATWLDANQVRELEPALSRKVVGGWWFPEDASVDARKLTCALRAACVGMGVQFQSNLEVTSLDLGGNQECQGLWCSSTAEADKKKKKKFIRANDVVVANGAWMRNLLPVPIVPHKGQSLSLRMPNPKDDEPPLLQRVMFAQDSYIVPKEDGRIVVGATVEAGSFDGHITPAGLLHIMSYMIEIVPALQNLVLEETWAGLRPTTPDKAPILGRTSQWNNLYLAGGYWRNGVLLAPKTGHLLASQILKKDLSKDDKKLLNAFSWDRFLSEEGAKTMTVHARHAASMHPVQYYSSSGTSASVGTELGTYSTAASAKQERAQDREALIGDTSAVLDDFERAAQMGVKDGLAFEYEKSSQDQDGVDDDDDDDDDESMLTQLSAATGIPERAIAEMQEEEISSAEASSSLVEESDDDDDDDDDDDTDDDDDDVAGKEDLASIYKSIQTNMATREIDMIDDDEGEELPDPGFRINFIHPETRLRYEVPPFTPPEEMLELIAAGKAKQVEALTDDNDPANMQPRVKTAGGATTKPLAEQPPQPTLQESTTATSRQVEIGEQPQVESNNNKDSSYLETLVKPSPVATKTRPPPPPQPATTTSASSLEEAAYDYDDSTFDGYSVLLEQTLGKSMEEIREDCKKARMSNRFEFVDESQIGARPMTPEDVQKLLAQRMKEE